MLRVREDMLTIENDKYYYLGKIFTGIAFTILDGVIKDKKKYKAGECIGDYVNEYLPGEVDALRIDWDYLEPENEDDYEPLLRYQGKLFDGIAYDFEDEGVCTGENLYIDGWSESGIGYYKSGMLESVDLIEDNFSQCYEWYGNSQVKSVSLFERDYFDIKLEFSEKGHASSIWIEGDYFSRLPQIIDKLQFELVQDKHLFSEITCANRLFMTGEFVTDEIFSYLFENDGFKLTDELIIHRTSLTSDSLNKLVSYRSLKKLSVVSNIINLDDLKAFKSQRSDCYVEIDRESVRTEVTA